MVTRTAYYLQSGYYLHKFLYLCMFVISTRLPFSDYSTRNMNKYKMESLIGNKQNLCEIQATGSLLHNTHVMTVCLP